MLACLIGWLGIRSVGLMGIRFWLALLKLLCVEAVPVHFRCVLPGRTCTHTHTTTTTTCVARPYLYTLVTDILSGQDVVDSVNTTVGVSGWGEWD